MPTDTERREVARRLWEVQSNVIPGTKTEENPITGRIIGVACWYDLPDFQGLLGRLADLIEPEERTCRNIATEKDKEWGSPFICSVCGADPHDAESYFCGFSRREHDWSFCPNCGARVVEE